MATSEVTFLIVKPENGAIWDLVRLLIVGDKKCYAKFLECSGVDDYVVDEDDCNGSVGGEVDDLRWVIFVSILVRKILKVFEKPLEWTGYFLEFLLNLFSLNGSFLGLLYNILHGNNTYY